MAINSYFYNAIYDSESATYDRLYNAEDVTSYLDKIVGSGVFPNPSNQLQVRTGTGMQVIVNEGQGWIQGHKLVNTADLMLTVDPADALLHRIDRVVFYSDSTERTMGIEIKKGTSSANPVAPALVRTENRYEMSLATISIRKGTTALSNAMISDTRPDSRVCGWVQGLIQQVDTSSLFVQWETAYSEFMAQMEVWKETQQAAFEAWLATLTDDLEVGAYVTQYKKVVTGGSGVSNIVPLDMAGYEYSNLDILLINLNGLSLVSGVDYTIDTTPATPTVNINAQLTANNRLEITALKTMLGVPSDMNGDNIEY